MFHRIISLLSIALFFTACASKKKELSPDEKRAMLYYNQGTRELVAEEYTLALQKLLRANKLMPNDSRIINNLAMAYYFKKDKANAVRLLKKSLKLDSSNADAKLNLATIYMKDGELSKAEEIYKNLLEDLTYMGHNRTYYNLALIKLSENNSTKAIEYLNKAVEVDPNYCPAFYKLGQISKERKDYKRALEYYKDATMGVCYQNIKPHIAQVEMMMNLHRYDDARIKLDEMLEKFAMTKDEVLVKMKIDEVNKRRRIYEQGPQEYSKKLDRNFLSTDF